MRLDQEKLAKIKKMRLTLRNKRIKLLKPEQISVELNQESIQVEDEIKKIQQAYYVDKVITELEYKNEFEILNGRYAEIEGEKSTLELLKDKKIKEATPKTLQKEIKKAKKEIKKQEHKKDIFLKITGFFKRLFRMSKEKVNRLKVKQEHQTKFRKNKNLKWK